MSEHVSRLDHNLLNVRVKFDNGVEGHIRAVWAFGSTVMAIIITMDGNITKRCIENVKFVSN